MGDPENKDPWIDDDDKDDPFLEAELDRAMEGFQALLPPDLLEHARDLWADFLVAHPTGRAMLARVRPRPMLKHSTDVPIGGAAPQPKKEGKAS